MKGPDEGKVSSQYGAPMGRRSNLDGLKEAGRIHLRRVRLDSGGYDRGGAYWGAGVPLYCAWNDGGALFFRAANRDAAKAVLNAYLAR